MKTTFTKLRQIFTHPIGIAALTILGVAFCALVQGVQYTTNLAALGKLVGLFAMVGAFLGTIYATDPCESADFKVKNRPAVRTVISFCIGGLIAYMLQLNLESSIICIFAFGLLGWLGMKWAKFVDF